MDLDNDSDYEQLQPFPKVHDAVGTPGGPTAARDDARVDGREGAANAAALHVSAAQPPSAAAIETPPRPASSSSAAFHQTIGVDGFLSNVPSRPSPNNHDALLIAQLQTQLQEERQKRAKLNESLLRLREKVTQEVSRLESTVTEQEATINELREVNAGLLADHDAIAAMLKQREDSLAKSKREIQHALFQRDCALGDAEEAKSQAEEKQEEVDALTASNVELEEELRRLSERLNVAELEVEKLGAALETAHRQAAEAAKTSAPPLLPFTPTAAAQAKSQLGRPRSGSSGTGATGETAVSSSATHYSPGLTGSVMILTPEQLLTGESGATSSAAGATSDAQSSSLQEQQKKQLELEISSLKARIEALTAARDTELEKRKTLERELAVALIEGRSHASRLEDLQRSLEDARKLGEEFVAQREDLRQKLDTEKKSRLTSSSASPSLLHEDCRRRERELEDKLSGLQRKLDSAESECERLKAVINAQTSQRSPHATAAAGGGSGGDAAVALRLKEAEEGKALALKDLEAATTYGRALLAANRRLQGEVLALQTTLAVRVGGSLVAGGGIVLGAGSAPISANAALVRSPTGAPNAPGSAARYHRITASSVSSSAPPPPMPTMLTTMAMPPQHAGNSTSIYTTGLFSPSSAASAAAADSLASGVVGDNRSSFALAAGPASASVASPLVERHRSPPPPASASAARRLSMSMSALGGSLDSGVHEDAGTASSASSSASSSSAATSVRNLLALQMSRPVVPPRPPVGVAVSAGLAATVMPSHEGGSFDRSRRRSSSNGSGIRPLTTTAATTPEQPALLRSSGPAYSRLMESRNAAANAADRAMLIPGEAGREDEQASSASSSSSASGFPSAADSSARLAASRLSHTVALLGGEGFASVSPQPLVTPTGSVATTTTAMGAAAPQSQVFFSGVSSRMSLLAAALEAERAKRQAIEGTVATLKQQVQVRMKEEVGGAV